jgi:hypothetical protein
MLYMHGVEERIIYYRPNTNLICLTWHGYLLYLHDVLLAFVGISLFLKSVLELFGGHFGCGKKSMWIHILY